MSKYYIVGGLLCISGLVIVGFQAISSMMAPGEMVWKSLNIAGIVDAEHLKWIDSISWYSIKKIIKYIVTMPLYILLLCLGGLSLAVGGGSSKKPDDDESVLELTNEVAEASEDAGDHAEDTLATTIELDKGFDDYPDFDSVEDDFLDSLGMEIGAENEEDEEEAEPVDTVPAEGIVVSSEQLDAALERVIKTIFHDKIYSVLVEVNEKTASKAIERLKRS